MLSLKLSNDVIMKSKAQNKGKKLKKPQQQNNRDVFIASLLTGDSNKTDKGRSRETKVWEAREKSTQSRRF